MSLREPLASAGSSMEYRSACAGAARPSRPIVSPAAARIRAARERFVMEVS
jgi:hypothetical protein